MTDLTKEDIQAALSRLGSTSDEIAESLQTKQCTGKRGRAASCPIANYLHLQFPGQWFDVIPRGSITHGVDPTWVEHNLPMADFIRKFDQRLYPELIA